MIQKFYVNASCRLEIIYNKKILWDTSKQVFMSSKYVGLYLVPHRISWLIFQAIQKH